MDKISSILVLVVFSSLSTVSGFISDAAKNSCVISKTHANEKQQQSNSALNASIPPMIIGPMIRKIREANEKKKNANG